MKRTFFANATLVDGVNAPQEGMTVVVEGNRITAVCRSTDAPAPETQDQVFDVSGLTLMPGLFQCHMHAAMDDIMSYRELDMKYPANYLTLIAARNTERMLRLGFTTTVGAGSPANIDVVLKHAIGAGLIAGPRFHACGRHICTTGESLDYIPSFWKSGIEGFGHVCDGPEEFRKAVRSEIKDGVDIVKVHVSGGHGSNLSADYLAISFEELLAASQAAHERGKKIRTHSASKEGILLSVRAGVDLIDHVDFLDDECIEAFLENGTSIAAGVLGMVRAVQAMEAYERRSAAEPQMNAPDPLSSPFFNSIRMDKGEFERALDNFRKYLPRALEAGVNIVNGDDFGGAIIPHGTYADELVTYVKEIGIPAKDVITWATRNSARFLGETDLGVVAEGKIADLLIVKGNPVEDITVLQQRSNFLAILKDGEFVERRLGASDGISGSADARALATLRLA
jgi:imidazolonepropionase-like amidohydrolase